MSSQNNFVAGIFGLMVGGLFIFGSAQYEIGTLTDMGAGFYPLLLGSALVLISLLIVFSSALSDSSESDVNDGNKNSYKKRLRAVFFVCAGLLSFIILGNLSGFIPAGIALLVLSSLADPRNKLIPTIISAIVIVLIASLIFIKGIGIQFPLF